MKIALIALFVSLMAVPAQAQERKVRYLTNYENEPYHFGFLVAFNQMMFNIKTVESYQNVQLPGNSQTWPDASEEWSPQNTDHLNVYKVETEKGPGFTVGIIGSKRLGRYFDLRFTPTLSFGERRINYSVAIFESGNLEPKEVKETHSGGNMSINTVIAEFPLHIKYRSKRYNNIGAYLIGGINPKRDFAIQKKKDADDPSSVNQQLNTRRFDIAAEVGVGFDIYNQWFKMGVELKMSYGLLDIMTHSATATPTIYTAPIDQLHNKILQFSLIFE